MIHYSNWQIMFTKKAGTLSSNFAFCCLRIIKKDVIVLARCFFAALHINVYRFLHLPIFLLPLKCFTEFTLATIICSIIDLPIYEHEIMQPLFLHFCAYFFIILRGELHTISLPWSPSSDSSQLIALKLIPAIIITNFHKSLHSII